MDPDECGLAEIGKIHAARGELLGERRPLDLQLLAGATQPSGFGEPRSSRLMESRGSIADTSTVALSSTRGPARPGALERRSVKP
jgi:hypothetical protein